MAIVVRASRGSRRARRAGFTLLELIVVMSILAILLGLGVGVLGRLNFAKYAALGTLRSVLRSARENAVASGLPITVVCDRADRRIYDLSLDPVGYWQFEEISEEKSSGAFGLSARTVHATVEPVGRFGAGLVCTQPRAHAVADPGPLASWSFSAGCAVEGDVFPDREQTSVLFRRGDQIRIVLQADGSLDATIALVESELPGARSAGSLVATTPPGAAPPGRWTRVGVVYDRHALTILADGVPQAAVDGTWPVAPSAEPFEMGDAKGAFHGRLDSVKVSAVVSQAGTPLPKDVEFAFTAPRVEVRFASDGRLDPAFHRGSLAVGLLFGGTVRREVLIGPYGTVR